VDGLSAVQARIGTITSTFGGTPVQRSTWTTAAAGAGLTGATATGLTGTSGLTGLTGAASTATTGSATGPAAAADAQKYLGVPYRWGGTDPSSGLDCSGLTQRVYADLGVTIPRTAAQQATIGTAVASLDQARPGDLVFFDDSSSRPGIDHVGIYVGDGKMIAAPTEGQTVKVQDVGTPTLIRRVSGSGSPATGATAPALPATGSGRGLAGVPYADLFSQAASRYGVSASLLAGLAQTESGFNSSAVSAAGAQGLMQFMPSTAASLGVDTSDPASSIDGAARYLKSLQDQFGSTPLALAAYNAGPAAVQRYGGVPPYAETQSYVQKVLSAAEAYS
jgi:peptidoglycan DL-endopeptidase CwlO